MTSLAKHLKPGTDVSRTEFNSNFAALTTATAGVSEADIDPGSIDYRHIDGTWKILATYSDYSNTYTSAAGPDQIASNQLLLPTTSSTPTNVGLGGFAPVTPVHGNPVLVMARLRFTAGGGNTQARFGIWLNGSRMTYVDLYVEDKFIQTVNVFYMFESTQEAELIEFRSEVNGTVSPLNYSIEDFEMSILSVRT